MTEQSERLDRVIDDLVAEHDDRDEVEVLEGDRPELVAELRRLQAENLRLRGIVNALTSHREFQEDLPEGSMPREPVG